MNYHRSGRVADLGLVDRRLTARILELMAKADRYGRMAAQWRAARPDGLAPARLREILRVDPPSRRVRLIIRVQIMRPRME